MIIYQISLPRKQDSGAFVKFMREEYFPAVHKGSTRVGKVTGLSLLELEPARTTKGCKFFWHVGWSGLATGEVIIDEKKTKLKFAAFKPTVKRLGTYREVAVWP